MDFLTLAAERFSCKHYDGRPVPDELLQKILEAGRLAPTAKNLQDQRIYVVRSPEGLKKIDAVTPCRYGAPVVLVVAYDKNAVYSYPGGVYTSDGEDATIVATHMMLAAQSLGVNSCWLNCFDPDKTAKLFELPENEQVQMLLDLGYAAENGGPLANHTSRKPLSATVKEV